MAVAHMAPARFSPGSVNFSHGLDPEYRKRRMVRARARFGGALEG